MLKGYKEFILRGNVVDLAIAIVIGTAFTAVVKAIVADILTPFVAAIVGQPNFAALKFTLHSSTFLYGDLVNAIVTFIAVSLAVYLFVVFPMNKIAERRARQIETVESLPPDIALLTEIRDLLADRQPTDGDS